MSLFVVAVRIVNYCFVGSRGLQVQKREGCLHLPANIQDLEVTQTLHGYEKQRYGVMALLSMPAL